MLQEAGYPQFKDCSPTVGFIEVILEKFISTSTFQYYVNVILKETGLQQLVD